MIGKFLAAWVFLGLCLDLTIPIWITVNYLGDPDNGAIFAAYIGSWLMAGGMLAIGSCMSALTRNQVIAFILAVVACCYLPSVLKGRDRLLFLRAAAAGLLVWPGSGPGPARN